jgi:hypothetical protein
MRRCARLLLLVSCLSLHASLCAAFWPWPSSWARPPPPCSALLSAARRGDVHALRAAAARGTDVRCADEVRLASASWHQGTICRLGLSTERRAPERPRACAPLPSAHAHMQHGDTALHLAARHARLSVVQELLLSDSRSKGNTQPLVHAGNAAGATPLHAAAEGGDASVVRLLLARGAAVDARKEVRCGTWQKDRDLSELADARARSSLLLRVERRDAAALRCARRAC